MRLLNKLFMIMLRIFVIVVIGGVVISNMTDLTYSAIITNKPNVLVTINEDGSISYVGNLFEGQLYPSSVDDAEKGVGGISGVIRIENQFKKIDVDNLSIGIKELKVGNNYQNDIVYNSFINNIRLKIEKGRLFNFDKVLVDYTNLENILYEVNSDEYQGYNLNTDEKFILNKGDTIDLKYTLHMVPEAGDELESITAVMPIYINLKESHIIDDGDDDDESEDDDDVVTIKDSKIPLSALNKKDHFKYIQGYPDNTVRPEGLITREEVSAVFYRLLESGYRLSISTEEENFLDVDINRWSIKCIATLANVNIIEGYPNGKFKPGSPITRAELATIASKFDKLSVSQSNKFSDIDGHWAIDYINSAAAKGWVNGYLDGTFKPDQYISRAEFVTLVNNVLSRGIHRDSILKEARVFSDLSDTMWYYEDMQEAINSHTYSRNEEDISEIWIELIEPALDL